MQKERKAVGGSKGNSGAKQPQWSVVPASASVTPAVRDGVVPNLEHPEKQREAIDNAMLATAFAVACTPGTQTIILDALPATLRRAGVPHVDALGLDTSASELTGHVSLTFAEVLQIASKLRSRGPEVVPFGEPADGSAAPAPTAKDPSSGTIAQGAYSLSLIHI